MAPPVYLLATTHTRTGRIVGSFRQQSGASTVAQNFDLVVGIGCDVVDLNVAHRQTFLNCVPVRARRCETNDLVANEDWLVAR